jgi:hypothetical protein
VNCKTQKHSWNKRLGVDWFGGLVAEMLKSKESSLLRALGIWTCVPHATSGEGSAVTRTTQHKKWFEEIAHVFNRHAIILSA